MSAATLPSFSLTPGPSVPDVDPNLSHFYTIHTGSTVAVYGDEIDHGELRCMSYYSARLSWKNISDRSTRLRQLQLLKINPLEKPTQYLIWNPTADQSHAVEECGTQLAEAKWRFESIFLDLTKNEWSKRHQFVQQAGAWMLYGYEPHMQQLLSASSSASAASSSASSSAPAGLPSVDPTFSNPIPHSIVSVYQQRDALPHPIYYSARLMRKNVNDSTMEIHYLQLLVIESIVNGTAAAGRQYCIWSTDQSSTFVSNEIVAKLHFESIFREKTSNEWSRRDKFIPHEGAWMYVKYGVDTVEATAAAPSEPTDLRGMIVKACCSQRTLLSSVTRPGIRASTCASIETFLNRAAHLYLTHAALSPPPPPPLRLAPMTFSLNTDMHYEPKLIDMLQGFARIPYSTYKYEGPPLVLIHSTVITRWYREVGETVNIPAELQSEKSHILLQKIISQLFHMMKPRLLESRSSSVIGPRELFEALDSCQFSVFWRQLSVDCDGCEFVRGSNIGHVTLRPRWILSQTDAMKRNFPSEARAMTEMNQQSWYHQKVRINEIVRQFVSGERQLSNVDLLLRRYHIRVLQFIGRRDLKLPTTHHGHQRHSACRTGIITFALIDASGVEHRFRLEYTHRHSMMGDDDGKSKLYDYDAVGQQTQSLISNGTVGDVASITTHILTSAPHRFHTITFHDSPPLLRMRHDPLNSNNAPPPPPPEFEPPSSLPTQFIPHFTQEQHVVMDAMKRNLSAAAPEFDEEPTACKMEKRVALNDLASNEIQLISKAFNQVNLTDAIRHVIPFTEFSRYGPTLYEDNHTPQARRDFTAAMIDASMSTAELDLLPSVILTLISEYHTLPLPFLEDEAKKQMSQYPLIATHSNYPSHNSNPVEAIQRLVERDVLTWNDATSSVETIVPPSYPTETTDESPRYGLYEYIPPLPSNSDLKIDMASHRLKSAEIAQQQQQSGFVTHPSSTFSFGGSFGSPPPPPQQALQFQQTSIFGTTPGGGGFIGAPAQVAPTLQIGKSALSNAFGQAQQQPQQQQQFLQSNPTSMFGQPASSTASVSLYQSNSQVVSAAFPNASDSPLLFVQPTAEMSPNVFAPNTTSAFATGSPFSFAPSSAAAPTSIAHRGNAFLFGQHPSGSTTATATSSLAGFGTTASPPTQSYPFSHNTISFSGATSSASSSSSGTTAAAPSSFSLPSSFIQH